MNWLRRHLLLVSAIFVVAIFLLCVNWSDGGRGFFSPDTLDCRTQSEMLFPGTKIPIYRSTYDYHRYELVEYLIAEGYWSPVETTSPRWFATFHWNRQWRDGTSDFHRAFGWRSEEWIQWTKDHPEIAAKLWPVVLDALRTPTEPDVSRAQSLLFIANLAATLKDFEVGVAEMVERSR